MAEKYGWKKWMKNIVVNYGKKIFQGSAKETKNSPEVIEAYLGTED